MANWMSFLSKAAQWQSENKSVVSVPLQSVTSVKQLSKVSDWLYYWPPRLGKRYCILRTDPNKVHQTNDAWQQKPLQLIKWFISLVIPAHLWSQPCGPPPDNGPTLTLRGWWHRWWTPGQASGMSRWVLQEILVSRMQCQRQSSPVNPGESIQYWLCSLQQRLSHDSSDLSSHAQPENNHTCKLWIWPIA